ncbi:TIGR03899 family protein [Shewanella cyperi]|uniref:TIGR03899 family protein n=1 Tax=Shewanella cyperi TaxID=2814292 RepID=A0A974XLM2_9GAMM|nr:TIGR03899 family protein [Shewanella cyperi]QSX30649.1 TIGR03899 family protein [Shewanella cyperi]
MSEEQEVVIEQLDSGRDKDVSARKKALLLGRLLGLASEQNYSPASQTLAERAEHRARKQAAQCQANVETIYAMALKHTPSDVVGSDPDPDWIYQFFAMAEQIHNRRMQELWARILAHELTNPGNFSLRSLETLKRLTWREALVLEKALGLSAQINGDTRLKLVSGYRLTGGLGQYFRKSTAVSLPLSQFGLPYSAILTLVEAGILHGSEFETGELAQRQGLRFALPETELTLTPKHSHLLLTYYRFTPVGDELAQLVKPRQDGAFVSGLKAVFARDFELN